MSDESETDQEQKTEDASDRRLQQAFDQGDIALSSELVSTGAFIAGVVVLFTSAAAFQSRLVRLVTEVTSLSATTPFASLPNMILPMAMPVVMLLFAMAAAGIILTFIQTKGHVWEERVTPDLSRVFSLGKLKQLFSKDFAIDLLIGVLKVAAVGYATWGVLEGELLTTGKLAFAAPGDAMSGLFGSVWKISIRALALLAVFATSNFVLVKYRYSKKHKMTKEELKREMKQDDGDPHMKAMRKRKHREMTKRNAVQETKQADVLLVNPTHIAIAIRYRKDDGGAPKVLAKGKGSLAEVMRNTARENGIPIVQDIPLARLLYKKVKVGNSVPADTYKAVAAILAFVYRMMGKTPAGASATQ